jgi:hypothetical protein
LFRTEALSEALMSIVDAAPKVGAQSAASRRTEARRRFMVVPVVVTGCRC